MVSLMAESSGQRWTAWETTLSFHLKNVLSRDWAKWLIRTTKLQYTSPLTMKTVSWTWDEINIRYKPEDIFIPPPLIFSPWERITTWVIFVRWPPFVKTSHIYHLSNFMTRDYNLDRNWESLQEELSHPVSGGEPYRKKSVYNRALWS